MQRAIFLEQKKEEEGSGRQIEDVMWEALEDWWIGSSDGQQHRSQLDDVIHQCNDPVIGHLNMSLIQPRAAARTQAIWFSAYLFISALVSDESGQMISRSLALVPSILIGNAN